MDRIEPLNSAEKLVAKAAVVIDAMYFVPGLTTYEQAKRVAKSVVDVTIKHLRDNLSEKAVDEAEAARYYHKAEDGYMRPTIRRMHHAMLSQVLTEMEGK